MSDGKFRVIREKKVGIMDDTLRAEWDRLYEFSCRLQKDQEKYAEGLDAFGDALRNKFGADVFDSHNVEPKYRIEADSGEVYLDFCGCPVCQAQLNSMSVVDTVEEMYKSNLISDEAIDNVRRKAKVIDEKQETGKKLLN